MLHIAYDITSLTQSPLGGIAEVCYHTVRQAANRDGVKPVGCYRGGDVGALSALKVDTRRVHLLSGLLPPTYDIAHSLCHRTLNVRARKTVYVVHDIWSLKPNPYQSPDFQKKLGRRLRDDILRADFIVTSSETTRQALLETGLVPPERSRAVHLGFEHESLSTSEELDPAVAALQGRTFVLFVGCLEVRKNLGHVLDAARPLEKVHVVLAGTPGHGFNEQIKQKLAAYPDGRLHHFTGLGRADLKALYGNAIALLLPSWEEGFGLPIVEAMAYGCPVITSNRSANAEIGGDAAVLVDPEKPGESQSVLERLLEDDSYRAAIIESGKSRANMFTWRKYFDNLMETYRQLLGE